MEDLISVIIPVYNVEKYIRRCLDSVLAQEGVSLEVILVDDGSTDSSGAICEEYAKKDGRIRVLHQKNGGLSSARNAGLAVAGGTHRGIADVAMYFYQAIRKVCTKTPEQRDRKFMGQA